MVKMGLIGVYIIFLFLTLNIDCGYSLEPGPDPEKLLPGGHRKPVGWTERRKPRGASGGGVSMRGGRTPSHWGGGGGGVRGICFKTYVYENALRSPFFPCSIPQF